MTFTSRVQRVLSSAGSEHLVYTERVGGSNPSAPTQMPILLDRHFYYLFYVYIIYSKLFDKYYIGQTNDVSARLVRHNCGLEDFTSKYVPWVLIGYITKSTRSEAVVLEKKLKNLSRVRLLVFIEKYCK